MLGHTKEKQISCFSDLTETSCLASTCVANTSKFRFYWTLTVKPQNQKFPMSSGNVFYSKCTHISFLQLLCIGRRRYKNEKHKMLCTDMGIGQFISRWAM